MHKLLFFFNPLGIHKAKSRLRLFLVAKYLMATFHFSWLFDFKRNKVFILVDNGRVEPGKIYIYINHSLLILKIITIFYLYRKTLH